MSKGRIKVGVYGVSLLMMGVIFVSGALSTIGSNFPDASQTMIQNLVAIPCLAVIPTTIIVGLAVDKVSKKTLSIIGVVLFLIGGIVPVFLNSLGLILVFRAILGVGIGICQVIPTALGAQYFEGAEREKVQGMVTAMQMLGAAVMIFISGRLAEVSWRYSFIVYAIAIVSLILAFACIPGDKPVAASANEASDAPKAKLTGKAWIWALVMFIFFIAGMVFSVFASYLIAEKGVGTAAQSGNAVSLQMIGGFIMGLIYGKFASVTKKVSLSIGFLGIALAYILMAVASSVLLIYVGAFIFGLALSIVMPCIFVEAGNAVPPAVAGLSISMTTCAQNLGQFVCPYIMNPFAGALSGSTGAGVNTTAFWIAAVWMAVMFVIALIWGIAQNRKLSK